MILFDVIETLSRHYPIQIGVNGSLVGVFEHADEIPYKYLNLRVNCIYPGIIENTHKQIEGINGLNPVAPKAVMRLDLVTVDYEED